MVEPKIWGVGRSDLVAIDRDRFDLLTLIVEEEALSIVSVGIVRRGHLLKSVVDRNLAMVSLSTLDQTHD